MNSEGTRRPPCVFPNTLMAASVVFLIPLSTYNMNDFSKESTKSLPVSRFQKEFSKQMSIAGSTKMGMRLVEYRIGKEVLSRPVKMQSEDIHLECDLVVERPESLVSKLASRRFLKWLALREVGRQ